MHKLVIKTFGNEDFIDIYLDNENIVSVNYDDHGFAGIEIAQDVAVRMADKLGVDIEYVEAVE